MSTRVTASGGFVELTAAGVLTMDRWQASEAFQLVQHVREHGGGPQVVVDWLAASGSRFLAPVLASRLAEFGYEASCALCQHSIDGRTYSRAALLRRFGLDTSHAQRLEHRRHARRRRRPLPEGEGPGD